MKDLGNPEIPGASQGQPATDSQPVMQTRKQLLASDPVGWAKRSAIRILNSRM